MEDYFDNLYQIKSKLLKYSFFGRVPHSDPLREILVKGVIGTPKIFTGYLLADGKFEGRFLLSYLVKKAFNIDRTSEGYETCQHIEMISELEKRASTEISLAIKEVETIYNHVQDKLDTDRVKLKRVLPSTEDYKNKCHLANIISGYTLPNSVGNYGSNHDRIMLRDVPSEDIFIHPKYVKGFLDDEYEFIVLNRAHNGILNYTEKDNVVVTSK